MGSIRLLRLVLVAALLVPGVLFAAAAWQNHKDVMREGHDAIERTAAILQEHARKVFETAELAIGLIDDHLDDQDWAAIRAPGTSDFLRRLRAPMEQLVSLWVADADGVVQAGSQPWPAGSGIAERPFFQEQKTAAAHGDPPATTISPAFTGLATTTGSFALMRRRTAQGGGFDGTVHAAINPAYFMRFYAEAAPTGPHIAALLLADGSVLAQEPAVPVSAPGSSAMPLGAAVTRSIRAGALGTIQSGLGSKDVLLDYSVRRVGATPAYVVFAMPRSALLQRWHRNLQIYGLVSGGAAFTLLGVAWLALRRAQVEQTVLLRLEEATRRQLAAEQQLRHSQRMDAVGQLTGGVAHDFNNLLTAILGNLELIQRAAGAGLGPDAAQRIERLTIMAMKAVQRGASLTKSLLAFSRKQPLQAQAVHANALLDDFMDLVRQALGPGVTVVFEPADTLPACHADPAELEAAVLNLAINARDAMGQGGRLVLRTMRATLDAAALEGNDEAQPGDFVVISVQDSGSGMTQDVAAKAFEPFFTTKPPGHGTGLGLSQVFGFARQLGGHVRLVSAPGAGTEITLYLPVYRGL